MVYKLKQRYVDFLGRDKKNLLEMVLHGVLLVLSAVYGAAIILRNFFYDKKIPPVYDCGKPVVCVGNISWSGTGKTTLAMWLYRRLKTKHRTAVLRRGYGADEGRLWHELTADIFSAPDRVSLAKSLRDKFDLLILDDGFQHRRLKRAIDIVVISARDIQQPQFLIPAGILREPWSALKRAKIALINHSDELPDPDQAKKRLESSFPGLKVFLGRYALAGLTDLAGKSVDAGPLKAGPIAALCAVGYPAGFFNMLEGNGFRLARKIVYPDHYELKSREFTDLQNDLLRARLDTVIVTKKDVYHLPDIPLKLKVLVAGIDMVIEDEAGFLETVNERL